MEESGSAATILQVREDEGLQPSQQQQQQPGDSGKLAPGVEITIGPHHLRCLEVLGSGSYSVVWRAQVLSSAQVASGEGYTKLEESQVALKDVFCTSHASLRQALFEVQLLLALERKVLLDVGADVKDHLRVPRCFSYKVDSREDGWRVRTAMTCLPGMQLDAWLDQTAQKVAAAAAEPFPLRAPVDGAALAPVTWMSFFRMGCAIASRLVCQVGPTLEHLAPLAWHRDVNSHNILIDNKGAVDDLAGSRCSFSLCDLGLAVDSRSWLSNQGDYWRITDIGGDCRYWPASSWMVHCYGADYLASQEEFCRQYQTRLDVHGIGITAVEIVCSTALAARRAGAPDDVPAHASGAAGDGREVTARNSGWARLLDAWQRYHENVSTWWNTIYQVFSVGGDFRPIHSWLVQESVPQQVVQFTADIRSALRDCARAAAAREWFAESRLLQVLAELTDEASRMELHEASKILLESQGGAGCPEFQAGQEQPIPQGAAAAGQMGATNGGPLPCGYGSSAGRLPTPVASAESAILSGVTFAEVPEVIEVVREASTSQTASPLRPPGTSAEAPAADAVEPPDVAAAAEEEASRALAAVGPIPGIVAVAAAALAGTDGRPPNGAAVAMNPAPRNRAAELAELRQAQEQLTGDLERLRRAKQHLQHARREQEAQLIRATVAVPSLRATA